MINQAFRRYLLLAAIAVWGIGFGATQNEREFGLGELHFEGDVMVLPLVSKNGQPMVIADVGDGNEYRFIVDTGASVNVLDSALAASMGFQSVGEMAIGAPGGPQIPAKIVLVPEATIGDAVLRGSEFVTMDIETLTGGMVHGVIGIGTFRDYLLTFDQPNGVIRASRDSLSATGPGVTAYIDADAHIQIDIDVAGTTVATHVDTGSMAGFTLPIEIKDALPLKEGRRGAAKARLVGGDRKVTLGKLDGNIVFANDVYESPDVGFMDPSPGYGNVGSRILADYVIAIDQKNRLVRFDRNTSAATSNNEPRRLGIEIRGAPGGDTLSVGQVFPGTLGEKAGFRSGDKVIALNGNPLSEYDMATLGDLLRGTEALSFEIDRDGELLTIEIQ